MTYISRRQLEALGEPIGELSRRDSAGRARYHGGGKDSPDAPDYRPMAQASKESAEIMAGLGDRQLAEGRRQYDANMQVAQPVVDKQLVLMDQTKQQGDDYYNYSRSIRPAERAMMGDAFGVSADDVSNYGGMLNRYNDALAKENFTAQQQAEIQQAQQQAASRAQSELDALNAQRTALAQTYQTQLQSASAVVQPQYNEFGQQINQTQPADTSALTNNYNTQLAALDQRISATRGGISTPTTKTAAYKLPANQIIGDKFFSGGMGYTARTDENGNITLLNSTGKKVGSLDRNGRPMTGSSAGVVNAFMNTSFAKQTIGGQIGKFDGNKYFSGGKAYYFDQAEDGSMKMYDTSGKQIGGYGINPKTGQPVYTGNTKLMQQALNDRSYKPALSGNQLTTNNGQTYTVNKGQGGTQILNAAGQVVATIDANGKVSGDASIGDAAKSQITEFAGTPQSEQLLRQADDFAARKYQDAAAAQRTKEQGVIDEQAGLDQQGRLGIQSAQQGLRSIAEANDQDIYNRNAGDIEAGVGNAISDARTGYSNAVGQSLREGMRYGFAPGRLSAMANSGALSNAQQQATMANAARQQGIQNTRGRLTSGAQLGLESATTNQGLRQQDFARNRGYNTQDKSIQWAKQLDAIGMGKGMPGASQGAYSLANQSGNSAVGNQMQPSNQLLGSMAQGASTIGQGRSLYQQGLGSILGAQTSMYNTEMNNQGDGGAGMVVGLASAAATAF